MGNFKAFLTIPRQEEAFRPAGERIHDFNEMELPLNVTDRRGQASRCMDCGVPFCNWACPLGNRPPEWNDALCKGDFESAFRLLEATNDFPEFTGRVCPALCEKSCVLNLALHEPTTNRANEAFLAEMAFRERFIVPRAYTRNGLKVAVVGSGPAGLAAANSLNRMGYEVTVLEKMEKAGGLLRFGIPNFKLDKSVVDRRISLMEEEGIHFRYGVDVEVPEGLEGFDGYIVATGTPVARDIAVPGRDLEGIHFALELLSQQNRILGGESVPDSERVTCKDKDVLVIGGGDTGSDCIGTAHRQGCRNVTQIEIMPKPPEGPDDPAAPWPAWPRTLKTTSSHEEGCVRRWNINTLRFLGENGRVKGAEVQPIDWIYKGEGRRPEMTAAGETEIISADIVLIASGFLRPVQPQVPDNVVFAGDAATGASLVVRAMASGKAAARQLDDRLKAPRAVRR